MINITEQSVVAAITSAGGVIAALITVFGTAFVAVADRARRHARAARTQVENGHTTNLRDDLDAIRAELRGVRRDIGRNSDRILEHDRQIERLWQRQHENRNRP